MIADQALLAIVAFAMVATFMALIMSGRVTAMVALILVPTLFGLLAGFGPALGPMMLSGVKELAPTGVMLIFAILFFGIMIDVGLFDPLTSRIVSLVHGDPVRILVGTAILALFISLDGDGATTYMITTAAMLPLYTQMKMDMRKMACVIIMAGAVMNILPWGGPTARVLSALELDVAEVFNPLIPAMAITACWVVFVAWRLGISERNRLQMVAGGEVSSIETTELPAATSKEIREKLPPRWWFNLTITIALMVALLSNAWPVPILFMLAFAGALAVNYPNLADQRERFAAHAGNALAVGGLIFAAGIFTGILSGTGMVDAMSRSVTGVISPGLGGYLAPITALLSAPFTYFISNDAFYFGVLPVLAETAGHYGLSNAEIGRASLVGQQVHLLSPLVPSTYLLAGLAGIEFGELVRTTFKWAVGSFLVFFAAAILTGAFPLNLV